MRYFRKTRRNLVRKSVRILTDSDPIAPHTSTLKKYGINEDHYEEMYREQKGGCAICGRPPKTRRLNIDHEHSSGFVRGLLCPSHNYGIGVFKDNPAHLRAAADYLEDATARKHARELDEWLRHPDVEVRLKRFEEDGYPLRHIQYPYNEYVEAAIENARLRIQRVSGTPDRQP